MTTTTEAFLPTGGDDLVAAAQIDQPVPAPDQALMEVDAYSVNRGEILLLAGGRTDPPGKDVAGRVLKAADDGSSPPEGTRVVAHLEGGGWATEVAVEGARLVPVPREVTSEQAAALPLAGLTALRLLRAAGDVAGRRLLVTGASGGVGHYFVELATAAGAEVTTVSHSAERSARLAALGAQAMTSVDEAEGEFDVVLESVGGEVTGAALVRLRRGGVMLWYGQASGEPARLDFASVGGGPVEVTIRSFFYWLESGRDADDLTDLVARVADGRLHPEIGLVEGWERTPDVLAAVRDRRVRGNAVLTADR
jgi:NADPH:quinone reductase-like Zn-dependent oxidoreductase